MEIPDSSPVGHCESYRSPHGKAEYARIAVENISGISQVLQRTVVVLPYNFCYRKQSAWGES